MKMKNNPGFETEMKKPFKKVALDDLLFGNPETTSLEARIFNCISLIGAITGYVTIVTNFLFGLPQVAVPFPMVRICLRSIMARRSGQ
jgi:hypothetical protein